MAFQMTWMQRIARTQAVLSASWRILMEDKTLLVLPVLSSICLFLIVGAYLEPLVTGIVAGGPVDDTLRDVQQWSEAGAVLLTIATYAVGIYFNAALAICVLERLAGKTPTIVTGLRGAFGCLPQIIGWAVVSSTVGLLLSMLSRRSGLIGRLVVNAIGMAWSVVTFLVVPVLVAERKGPIEAVQESVQLFRRTWGEDLLAGIGFGGLYFLLSLPGMVAFVVGAGLIPSHLVLALTIMALSLLYFPALGFLLSTLSTIFDVVLYRYAKYGTITPGVDPVLLKTSFAARSTGG